MGIEHLPEVIKQKYEIIEQNHAIAILKVDFPEEYNQIINILSGFQLTRHDILTPGGRKSPISTKIDRQFYDSNWEEKQFRIDITVDNVEYPTPTHKVDCYKNKIGVEIEWNNKDTFYDRDLNNFRLLHDLKALSVGVIITRSEALQEVFNELGKGSSYGSSTTHLGKLRPKINGRGSGGCPLLIFAIKKECYVD
ncbi:BglII/BstYI family type II restriction endonuclease [Bacillus cereus group sp. TH150LC]|uniref:BglII/BstYI family type II restriction endonuclease n=1 Tax=Bacillus cereus group sp. TH150LC TaxID=3018061 RepID=UPI0022E73E60|nr:BglII/BstYI family type II restriction endonuclease [Bacillus cereus group sp. TH150LC]MDA1657013.1 BglII/BstYI family type II restriction endonuclease [Bacillus cereus group sp. TH150LC]HDR4513814.1 hypothetical protein [Bacillus cereus]